MRFADSNVVLVSGQVVLKSPAVTTVGEDGCSVGWKMRQTYRDHSQREFAVTVSVETPTVPIVDLVVSGEVGLRRARMVTE